MIVDPEAALPDQFETLGSRLDKRRAAAGGGRAGRHRGKREFYNLRQQRFNAGTAVANGLSYQAAPGGDHRQSRAHLGPRRFGSGRSSPARTPTLVIWNADPLETTSFPVAVFIAGQPQPMTSRETELRDRYLNPDRSYPPSYH